MPDPKQQIQLNAQKLVEPQQRKNNSATDAHIQNNGFQSQDPLVELTVRLYDKDRNSTVISGMVQQGIIFEDALVQLVTRLGGTCKKEFYASVGPNGTEGISSIDVNGIHAESIQLYLQNGLAHVRVGDIDPNAKNPDEMVWLGLKNLLINKDMVADIKDDRTRKEELPNLSINSNNTPNKEKNYVKEEKPAAPNHFETSTHDLDGLALDSFSLWDTDDGTVRKYNPSKENEQYKEHEITLQTLIAPPTYFDSGERTVSSPNLQPSFCIANMDTTHDEFHFIPIESPNSALQNTANVTTNTPQIVMDGSSAKTMHVPVEKTQKSGKIYIVYPYTYEDILASAQLRKMYGYLIGLVDADGITQKEINRKERTIKQEKKDEKEQQRIPAKKADTIASNDKASAKVSEKPDAKVLFFPNMNAAKKEKVDGSRVEATKKDEEETKNKKRVTVAEANRQVNRYTTKEKVLERLREIQNKHILERKEIFKNALNQLLGKLKEAKADNEKQNLLKRINEIKWALLRLERRMPEPKLKKEPSEIDKKEEERKKVAETKKKETPVAKKIGKPVKLPEKQPTIKRSTPKIKTEVQRKTGQQKVKLREVQKKDVNAQKVKVAEKKEIQVQKKTKTQKAVKAKKDELKATKKHERTVQLVKASQKEIPSDKIAEIKRRLSENLGDEEFGSPFESNNLSYVLGDIEDKSRKKAKKMLL